MEAVKEICRLSFGPVYRYFPIQSLTSEGPVLVCETNNVVAGFAKMVQSQIGEHKVGDILWLAVRLEFRRKNVGSTLIKAATSYFEKQGVRYVYASTGFRNKAALALFLRNDFQRIGFRGLLKIFGRQILRFYSEFWVAPNEIVLMHDNKEPFIKVEGQNP